MPVNQASEVNRLWWVRAANWSEGAGQTPFEESSRTEEIVAAADAKYRAALAPGEDVLPSPHNFHSNPGYMSTSTGSALQASQPGGIYRTAGGHMPMARGGPPRQRVPGKTVVPAGPGRQPESEGGPLVMSTGFPGR